MIDDQANYPTKEEQDTDDLGGTQGASAFATDAISAETIDPQTFDPEAAQTIPDRI